MSISLNDHENRIKVLEKHNKWIAGPVIEVTPGTRFSLPADYNEVIMSSPTSEPKDIMFMYLTHDVIKMCIDRGDINLYCLPSMYNFNGRHLLTLQTKNAIDFVIERNEFTFGTFKCWYTKRGGGINLGTLLKRLLVYIKIYSKLFHLQFLEVK